MKHVAVIAALFWVAMVCCLPGLARAQGCAQCRDNTASTSPATQGAFRHSIELMSTAAFAFFAGTFVVIRRLR